MAKPKGDDREGTSISSRPQAAPWNSAARLVCRYTYGISGNYERAIGEGRRAAEVPAHPPAVIDPAFRPSSCQELRTGGAATTCQHRQQS